MEKNRELKISNMSALELCNLPRILLLMVKLITFSGRFKSVVRLERASRVCGGGEGGGGAYSEPGIRVHLSWVVVEVRD